MLVHASVSLVMLFFAWKALHPHSLPTAPSVSVFSCSCDELPQTQWLKHDTNLLPCVLANRKSEGILMELKPRCQQSYISPWGHRRSSILCLSQLLETAQGFQGGSSGKEPTCQCIRDASSVPGWGSSPGGGHGNPLQHPCLESPMDRQHALLANGHIIPDSASMITSPPLALALLSPFYRRILVITMGPPRWSIIFLSSPN